MLLLLLLLPAFALAGGKSEGKLPETGTDGDALTVCTEPRPQMCTRDYRPVCAQLSDGTFKTYSNGCTACSDISVTGYRKGACEE